MALIVTLNLNVTLRWDHGNSLVVDVVISPHSCMTPQLTLDKHYNKLLMALNVSLNHNVTLRWDLRIHLVLVSESLLIRAWSRYRTQITLKQVY